MFEKVRQIKNLNNKFQVIWDVGRRCTYNCSYCPPYLHNSWAPTFDWEEMVKNLDFLHEYIDLYEGARLEPYKRGISFTGGEPTIHPRFFDFLSLINDRYPKLYNLGLTTNGAYSEKLAKKLADNISFCTLSYHAEADSKMKERVKQNTLVLHEQKKVKVNVMFHKDYFDECVGLCDWLDQHGIDYTPRRIGDQGNRDMSLKFGWAHEYSDEQEDWFDRYFNKGKYKSEKRKSYKGRMCCAKHDLCVNQKEKTKFIPDTNFYDWSCSVNWYFLMIMQEGKKFYNHQTCCVNTQSEVGPFATFSERERVLQELRQQLVVDKEAPVIRCPLKRCGCGLCSDKAETPELYEEIMKDKVKDVQFKHRDKPSAHAESSYTHVKPHTILGFHYDLENGNIFHYGKKVNPKTKEADI